MEWKREGGKKTHGLRDNHCMSGFAQHIREIHRDRDVALDQEYNQTMDVQRGVFISERKERYDFLFPPVEKGNTVDAVAHCAFRELIHLYLFIWLLIK